MNGTTFAAIVVAAFGASVLAASPASGQALVDPVALEAARQEAEARWASWQGPALRAVAMDPAGPTAGAKAAGANLALVGVTASGHPLYFGTDNLVAAATVGASRAWPGGDLGLALDGANARGELALWDAGSARSSHQEFAGRVHLRNAASGHNFHATHVTGTLVGSGVVAAARGMSFAGQVDSYEWQQDDEEMIAAAAAGLLLSNHSYGFVTGWQRNDAEGVWYWYGDPAVSPVEDHEFGFYGASVRAWDQIAAAAPHYLICVAAGNDRNHWGPGENGGHYYYDPQDGWTWSTAYRQPDPANGGYDTIGWRGNAKNVLTVGAVGDIAAGYGGPGDVVMTEFSNWGPTDDGRIKPDLVANGVELYSALDGSDTDYASLTGTSMATPCATGAINLLVQHHRATHGGAALRAATVKALVLHTADEAGAAPGPDYRHGWGLLDVAEAARLIGDDAATPGVLGERTLAAGASDTLRFVHDDDGALRVTLCWTDPAGPVSANVLDPTTPRLVNDLDLRVVRAATGQASRPWVLDPAAPGAAATTGDNDRDTVERVDVATTPAGEYLVVVGHEGPLTGAQAYSVVVGGLRPASSLTAVGDGAPPAPLRLAAHPNPFNPRTTIRFTLVAEQAVALELFGLDGRRVATLAAGISLPAGDHEFAWDGRDDRGHALPSGVYLARLATGTRTATVKLTLAR